MPTREEVFVGRLRELEVLRSGFEQAMIRHGRIALIAGEPGIGKTRTVQELAQFAAQRGAAVLWGQCQEEAGAPSYWPWLQIIRGALRMGEARASLDELGAAAGDIAGLVPEIRSLVPCLEPPARLEDAAQARFRMFDSIRRFIREISERRALLVVLDDMHWADAPSLRLLEFLASDLSDSGIMVVGTYRPTELSRQHPLSDTLGGLARTRDIVRLHLDGLSVEEVHALIAAATGTQAPDWLSRSLFRQTEGNPLFLREIVRFLADQGLFSAVHSAPLAGLPPAIRIPEGITEVIGRRLNLLSARCNEVLGLCAVIGRDFSHDLLLRAAGGDDQRLNDALDEALAAHVIEETDDRHYQFAHHLIRMTLYDELRPARRRQLHRAVGIALEMAHRADPGVALTEMARHFLAAGDSDRAIDYACRAGEHAEALLAFEDAAEFYQTALDAMEQRPLTHDPARCRLLFLLGEAWRKANDFPRAFASLRDAAELASALGLPEISARAAMAYELVAWRHAKETDPPPRQLLQRALRQVPDSEPALAAEVTSALSRALWHEGAAAEAVRQREQAIAMARRLDDPAVLAACLGRLLDIFGDGEDRDLLHLATETLTVADQVGNLELMHIAHLFRFLAFMELGAIAMAEAELTATARLQSRLRQPTYAFGVALNRVMLALMRGDLAETERLIARVMAVRTVPVHQEQLSVQIFVLRREQGRLRELQPVLSVFLDRIAAGSIWHPGLTLLRLELGQFDAARSIFEEIAGIGFAAIPRDGRWLLCIVFLCEACAALGDAARAAELYELLRPYAGRSVLAGRLLYEGSAGRYLGLLSATMGHWPEAEVHFAAALEANGRIGAHLPLARTQYDFAVMLLARGKPGDRERADGLLRACLDSARERGMARLEAKSASLLARLPGPDSTPCATHGLTAREMEVLRLLAIGRSNADIALVLSIRLSTVATHVRSILAKTDCANRTEAAAYAVRHGLSGESLH